MTESDIESAAKAFVKNCPEKNPYCQSMCNLNCCGCDTGNCRFYRGFISDLRDNDSNINR